MQETGCSLFSLLNLLAALRSLTEWWDISVSCVELLALLHSINLCNIQFSMFQIALRSEAYLCKTKIDAEESKKIWIDSLKKYTRGSINMNLFISQKKKKKKVSRILNKMFTLWTNFMWGWNCWRRNQCRSIYLQLKSMLYLTQQRPNLAYHLVIGNGTLAETYEQRKLAACAAARAFEFIATPLWSKE